MGHLSNHCGAVPGGLSFPEKRKIYKMPGGSSFPSQHARIFVDLGGDTSVSTAKKETKTREGCFGWWSQHAVAHRGPMSDWDPLHTYTLSVPKATISQDRVSRKDMEETIKLNKTSTIVSRRMRMKHLNIEYARTR